MRRDATWPRLLADAPVTLPMLGAVAVLVWWASDHVGYPAATWLPGTLILLGLLLVAAVAIPFERQVLPRPVGVAVVALAAFTAWSYASIGWAGDPGAAFEGANRTLAYLVIFTLFAAWGQRGPTALAVGTAWLAGIGALAAVQIVRVAGAGDAGLFTDGRLGPLSGYQNADAALWLMAAWAAMAGAAGRTTASWLRGVLAAGAVLLAELALMAQSRGAIAATGVLLLLFVASTGLRGLALLVPVAAGVAAAAPAALAVRDDVLGEPARAGWVAAGPRAAVLAAAATGLVVALGAVWLRGRPEPRRLEARLRRVPRGIAAAVAALALLAGVVALGDPAGRVSDAWHSFSEGGQPATGRPGRLASGLGSNRSDFYRVALRSFSDHPLEGVGADNFAQDYLRERHSDETPAYPHSVEVRTLSQTGLVGTVLLLAALLAAVAAGVAGARRGGHGGTVALGGLLAFAYWIVHGSVDWLWEFAGLGPRPSRRSGWRARSRPGLRPGSGRARRRAPRRASSGCSWPWPRRRCSAARGWRSAASTRRRGPSPPTRRAPSRSCAPRSA